jgi:hypothetical protein
MGGESGKGGSESHFKSIVLFNRWKRFHKLPKMAFTCKFRWETPPTSHTYSRKSNPSERGQNF